MGIARTAGDEKPIWSSSSEMAQYLPLVLLTTVSKAETNYVERAAAGALEQAQARAHGRRSWEGPRSRVCGEETG